MADPRRKILSIGHARRSTFFGARLKNAAFAAGYLRPKIADIFCEITGPLGADLVLVTVTQIAAELVNDLF